jgi:hypothetical protein
MTEKNPSSYAPRETAAFRSNGDRTHSHNPFSQTAAEAVTSARNSVTATWAATTTGCVAMWAWLLRLMPNCPLVGAYARYFVFIVLTKSFFGLIYFTMIAEGMRVVIPSSALKLYKVPFLAALEADEIGHRLDVAHFFSIALLLAAWYFAEKGLLLWLRPGETPDGDYDYDNYRRLITVLAAMVIGGDGLMFYTAVTEMGWGGTVISFTALVATCAYIGALMFVALASVNLKKKIDDLRKENAQ